MHALKLYAQDAIYSGGKCLTIRHAHSAVLKMKARCTRYGGAVSYVWYGIRSLDGFLKTTQVYRRSLIWLPLLLSMQTNWNCLL